MKTKTPKPDKAYREMAERHRALRKAETPKDRDAQREQAKELREIQEALRDKFQHAFGFSPDRLRLTERLYRRFYHTELRPSREIFDHKDYFRRGANFVIVSQPYGRDDAELLRWTEMVGATFVVAEEWGYYYPGRATLYFVEFTPEAKAAFDKRLRKL